jgi:hypothetical protein
MSPNAVYTTLLTNTAYLPGALVLERSLRSVGSQYPLVVMVSPGVSQAAKDVLRNRELRIVEVDNLDPPEGVHSLGGNDPRFLETWTKLRYVLFSTLAQIPQVTPSQGIWIGRLRGLNLFPVTSSTLITTTASDSPRF